MAFDAKAVLKLGDKGRELRTGDRVAFEGVVGMTYPPYTDIEIDEDSVKVVQWRVEPGEQAAYASTPVTVLCLFKDYAWVTRDGGAPFQVKRLELSRLPREPDSCE